MEAIQAKYVEVNRVLGLTDCGWYSFMLHSAWAAIAFMSEGTGCSSFANALHTTNCSSKEQNLVCLQVIQPLCSFRAAVETIASSDVTEHGLQNVCHIRAQRHTIWY